MVMNENVPGGATPREQAPTPVRLHPLHEAALKLASLGAGVGIGAGLNRPRGKTRDLVVMLLAHGARAWRGAQPKAAIHLHVTSPSRRHPVRFRVR